MTSAISPTMAAQAPTADGHVEEWELGHIPMAIPMPSGIARRTIRSTNRTIRSVLVTEPSVIGGAPFRGAPTHGGYPSRPCPPWGSQHTPLEYAEDHSHQ